MAVRSTNRYVRVSEGDVVVGVAESTRHAVLGLAVQGPTYAYAIAEEMRRWPLADDIRPNRRAVYHAVDRLVDEGLVEPRDATADDLRRLASAPTTDGSAALDTSIRSAPIRKLIEATSVGEDRFVEWLRSPLLTEDEVFWRLGAARRQDVPILIRVLEEAERTWFARLQEQMTPDVSSFAARGASWKAMKSALLGTAKSKQLEGQAAVLRELSALLTDLQRESLEAR
jgi:DNA-binding PadR family transcriptional regulator